MRIEFKKIEIYNFRSFDTETFDFTRFNGLNLLCGKNNDLKGAKNGSGKTNFISALVFSLFGQTQNGTRNSHIANSFAKTKEVRVATYFTVESTSYKVVSGFNKNGNSYCELSIANEDGTETDLTKSTIAETRKFLEEEILHCDLSIFMRTILLSSDQTYDFFKLKKAEKKDFIEKLFDISIFNDMYSSIHRDVLDSDKKMIALQNRLLQLNKSVEEYAEHVKKFNAEMDAKKNYIQEKIKTLKSRQDDLNKREITVNSEEVDRNQQTIEKYEQVSQKLSLKQNELKSKNQDLAVQIGKLSSLKDQKQKMVDKHADIFSKLCKDCKKVFSDYYSISQLTDEISVLNSQIKEIEIQQKDRDSNVCLLEQKLGTCEQKINESKCLLKKATAEHDKAIVVLNRLNSEIYSLEQQLVQVDNAENPYQELANSSEIELQQQQTDLEQLTKKYRYLTYAENIVSQDTLRKFIIGDLVGLLNNKIKMYLSKFGSNYDVIFDGDMDYKLITEGKEYDYADFSGGEKSRLMIAACFAFRDFMHIRNNFSSNILFLDEFIDGAIDSLAMENILEILGEYSRQYQQNIFIVSHRKSEMDNTVFDNIIQIVKTNHISKITYV